MNDLNYTLTEDNVWIVHHDSVDAFCALEPHAINRSLWRGLQLKYDHDRRETSWAYGSAGNRERLARRMREGWKEGAEKIQRLAAVEVGAAVSVRRAVVRSDQGDELDIHAVYRGQLGTAWRRTTRRARRTASTVRLVAVVGGAGRLTEDEFFYRGAALARLADLLTTAGYSVEIVAACVAESTNARGTSQSVDYCHVVPVKEARAPLDLSQLAAVLCQVGFVRQYMFKSFSALSLPADPNCGWFGNPDRMNQLAAMATTEDNVKTFAMDYSVSTSAQANAWILESIRKLEEEN